MMSDEVLPKQQELGAQGDAYDVAPYNNEQYYFAQWLRSTNIPPAQAPANLDSNMNIPATNAEANLSLYSFAQNIKTGLPQPPYLSDISEGDRAALSSMRHHMPSVDENINGMASRMLPNRAAAFDSVAPGYFGNPRIYGDAPYGLDAHADASAAATDPTYQGYVVGVHGSEGRVAAKQYTSIEKNLLSNDIGYNNFNYDRDNKFHSINHPHHQPSQQLHYSDLRNSDPGLSGGILRDARSSVDSGMRSSFSSTGRASVLSVQLTLASSVPTVRDYQSMCWANAQEQASYTTPKEWLADPQSPALSNPIRPALWFPNNIVHSAPEVMTDSGAWKQQVAEPAADTHGSSHAYSTGSSPTQSKPPPENCCPDLSCEFHHEGFKFRWLLRRHICNKHLKLHNSGRASKNDDYNLMSRFLSLVYVCPVAGCSRAFYRLDSLLRHQRLIHAQTKDESRRNKLRISPCEVDIFE